MMTCVLMRLFMLTAAASAGTPVVWRLGLVAARGRSDDAGERCDETAGVGPSAGVRGLGGIAPVGEKDERVVDA